MRYRGGSYKKKQDVFEIDYAEGEEIPELTQIPWHRLIKK